MTLRVLLVLALATGISQAATYYVTIAGLGGEQEFEQRFSGWAKDIDKLLKSAGEDAHVTTLIGAELFASSGLAAPLMSGMGGPSTMPLYSMTLS